MTCVAFGDFRVRESQSPGHSLEDQRQMRVEAKQAYGQALEIEPSCVEAYRGLAQVYSADEDYELAIGAYNAALRITPRDAKLWFELGMMRSRRKQWDPAIDALGHAAELEPENRQYANVLGFCLARAGCYEQSLACFSRVLGAARAHFNVSRMMVHDGHLDAAKQQLQLALQKEPKLIEARELLAQLERPAAAPPPAGSATMKSSGVQKVTVVNLRKEPALLFRMPENGKMTFVRKLPPGEAADVETAASQERCIAIFPDKQVGEVFDSTRAETIWLLR
jgi:tetratricopeptide (TPR) repeat protein